MKGWEPARNPAETRISILMGRAEGYSDVGLVLVKMTQESKASDVKLMSNGVKAAYCYSVTRKILFQ